PDGLSDLYRPAIADRLWGGGECEQDLDHGARERGRHALAGDGGPSRRELASGAPLRPLGRVLAYPAPAPAPARGTPPSPPDHCSTEPARPGGLAAQWWGGPAGH